MIWFLNRSVAICTDWARHWSPQKFFSAAVLIAGLFASALSGTGPAQAEKRIALVIGNSNYQNVPQLANPAADAKAIAEMLSAIGFQVDLQTDLDNLSLKRALRRFEDDANQADMAVIFFAGHGLEVRGVNYLIPIDANLADERDASDEAIALDRFVGAVTNATRLGLIILDACRDNPFAIRMKRVAGLRDISRGLARVEPEGAETLIAYAAKAGSTAEDGHGPHSPFTTALLNNLPTPGLDVELAFRRVRDEVLKVTGNRQEPFVYGSLSGKPIYLVPPQQPNGSPPPSDQNSAELLFWASVKDSRVVADYRAYLARYPNGIFAPLAANRVAELERSFSMPPTGSSAAFPLPPAKALNSNGDAISSVPPTSQVAPEKPAPPNGGPTATPAGSDAANLEVTFWNSIKDQKNPLLFEAYLNRYPNGAFADIARVALNELKMTPPMLPTQQADDSLQITDPLLLNELRDRLYELNFDPGLRGRPLTDADHEAIEEFQQQRHLPTTGIATTGLLRQLREIGNLSPWGAILYDKASGKWGMAWNEKTRKSAVARARTSCGDANSCLAEISFFGSNCGAFAHSETGWAMTTTDTIAKARQAALADCRKRGNSCQVIASVCADGTERFTAK